MIKTIIYLTKIAIVTAFALLFASCNHSISFGDGIKGSGKITSQTRTINGDFTKVHVSDGIQVTITQSTDKSVTVEADDNILQHIKTRVEDGVLIVESDESYDTGHTPNVTIKMPAVSGLVSEAGSNITGTNTIVTGDIKVSSESGSNIEVEVEADHIVAGTESGSQMRLRGKALKLEISSESGSNVDAGSLETNEVTAEAYSGSSMSVAPIVTLNAKAESGSSITYTKVPKTNLSKEENSGGSVSQQ